MRVTTALHELVEKLLVIRDRAPPADAREESELLTWFVTEGYAGLGVPVPPDLAAAYVMLVTILNGHWWEGVGLVHYCRGRDCCATPAETHRKVVQALLCTLLSCRPTVPHLSR